MARFRRGMSVVVAAVLVCGVATSAQAQAVRFVDDDAPPGGNGQSWQTAYRFLQDAFFDAAADPSIAEIRVAQGVYKPDRDEAGNVTAGDREASFQLRSGLALLGGFRGSGSGGDRDDRDIAAFETILSGDLAGDDEHVEDLSTMLEAPSRAENSLRVLTCSNTDDTAVLAGFTVTGGNTDTRSGARGGSGAGLLILQAAPTISECRFIENAAYPPFDDVGGGALANFVGSPTVQRCIFTRNAAGEGGALYITNFGTTIVADCTFADNWAIMGGAVVNAGGSSMRRRVCDF